MRSGPVGLLFFDQPAELVHVARQQGRITHQDPRCAAGSIAIAGAVALALRGGPMNPAAFVAELQAWVDPFDPKLGATLLMLPRWLAQPPEEVAALVASVGAEPGRSDRDEAALTVVEGAESNSVDQFSCLRSESRRSAQASRSGQRRP